MKNDSKHYFKLGLLVIAGLAFFIISVYFLGKKQNLFNSVINITAEFSDVHGLQLGSKVQFSGINVGTVSDIIIKNDSTVKVEMAIKSDVTQFISKDALVEINNEGLIGNKLISIVPGEGILPPIIDGSQLKTKQSINTDQLLSEAKEIMVSVRLVVENLNEVTGKMNTGDGDFSKLLNEDGVTTNINKLSHHLNSTNEELLSILQKANNGDGDISKLLNDDGLTTRINNILADIDSTSTEFHKVSENLHKASRQINNGNGTVKKLLYDSTMANNIDSSIIVLNKRLDEAKEAIETIEKSWILNVFSGD